TTWKGKRNQLLATDAPRLAPDPQLRHRGHHHHHKYGPFIDRCNTSFDAVARIRGETFFFKGLTMWRVNGGGLVSSQGASVRRLWRALPPDLPQLHAVLERPSDHAIIFISGSQFWLFRDLSLQEGFPQPLSSLRMGLSLDGADKVEEAAAERWGLVWEPEEGPVWGNMANAEEEKQEDDWTQLLREGVSGITTDSEGVGTLADAYRMDALDLHFHFRFSLQHRTKDGVHWNTLAHRKITSLLLQHFAQAWGVLLLCPLESVGEEDFLRLLLSSQPMEMLPNLKWGEVETFLGAKGKLS
ncbi:hypothetical protein KUCAC02_016609, partial [Chaenocephalus aceratus]